MTPPPSSPRMPEGALELPFDGDGGMYFDWFDNLWGDFDLPEDNERAREIARKVEEGNDP